MSDCIFCKIVAKEIPSAPVYESELVLAFPDLYPKAPTHILVIPKAHYASMNELPTDQPTLLCEITKALQEITKQEGIDASGYRVIVNTNADGGQEIPHVHWHILGGKPIGPMVIS